LVIINKIPALQLRLADEDEIIGTDWAQMGERAYGYLPFDEESGTPSSRRSNDGNSSASDQDEVQQENTANPGTAHHKNKKFNSLRKLLMTDRTTVIKGVPDLIEEPVLDYGQQKDMGGIGLHELRLSEPTGRDLLQKTPSRHREEIKETEPVDVEGNPMKTLYHSKDSDTTVNGSTSQSPKLSEKSKD
jgi:Amt family ammonium transporter